METQNQQVDDGDLNNQFADLEPDAAKLLQEGNLDGTPQESNEIEDAEEYSKKVQKRIGKEVYKTKTALTRAEVAEAELRKKNEEIARMRKEFNEREKERLTKSIDGLKKTAATALEAAETEQYMEVSDELLNAKVALARLEDEKFEEAPAPAPAQQQQAEDDGLAPAAQSWIDNNREWIDTNPTKWKKAQQLASQLEAKGYSPADEELYEKLDEMLNEQKPQPNTMSYGNVPGSSTPTNHAPNNNRLSTEDLRLMKQYQLDPNNADHRAHWLAGKKG